MVPSAPSPPDILCVGAVLWDIIGRSPAQMGIGSDVPGRITRLPGGVAMNIAATLLRVGLRPALLGTVGRDAAGDELAAICLRMGICSDFLYRSDDLPTDRYMAIEGANGLIAAIADAHSLEAAGDKILGALADGRLGSADRPWQGLIALDGNLTGALLSEIATSPLFGAADLRLAPASPGKALRLLPLLNHKKATFYVNLEEAGILCQQSFPDTTEAARGLLAKGVRRVLVTHGAGRCADAEADASEPILTRAPPPVLATRVTGAGDTFLAAHIAAEMRGADRRAALDAALEMAALHVSEVIAS